jgi:GNAT superfamily N-acetyltransferase
MDIRALAEHDLDAADRIYRLAFGTFLRLPDPMQFGGDSDRVLTRWRAAPDAVLAAYDGDQLIGSNFLTRWGSFGFFGPLTVHPDRWGSGAAQLLMKATMERFRQLGLDDIGLFTFPHSAKHVGLYQKYGFWPQHLTAVMAKQLDSKDRPPPPPAANWRDELEGCRQLAEAIMPGLDLTSEIVALKSLGLGELVTLRDDAGCAGFAIMHCGPGTEAGSGAGFVKFGAARDPAAFRQLLQETERTARAIGLEQLIAGVNTARMAAYRQLLDAGYKTVLQGVAMQFNNRPGFNRPDCLVIDDWR